jgi:hypothetical protein
MRTCPKDKGVNVNSPIDSGELSFVNIAAFMLRILPNCYY